MTDCDRKNITQVQGQAAFIVALLAEGQIDDAREELLQLVEDCDEALRSGRDLQEIAEEAVRGSGITVEVKKTSDPPVFSRKGRDSN